MATYIEQVSRQLGEAQTKVASLTSERDELLEALEKLEFAERHYRLTSGLGPQPAINAAWDAMHTAGNEARALLSKHRGEKET